MVVCQNNSTALLPNLKSWCGCLDRFLLYTNNVYSIRLFHFVIQRQPRKDKPIVFIILFGLAEKVLLVSALTHKISYKPFILH